MSNVEFGVSGLNTFEVGINTWTKLANRIIEKYGETSIVGYPGAKEFTGIPLLTSGAYTCYAGVAQSMHSGLYVFHYYEDDARRKLVNEIGGEPISGVYGGIPYHIQRTSKDQFADTNLKLLTPKDSALSGFNILITGNDIYYSAGPFNP